MSANDRWCSIIWDVDAGEHNRVSAAGACDKMANMPIRLVPIGRWGQRMMAEVASIEAHWNAHVLAFSADLHSDWGPATQSLEQRGHVGADKTGAKLSEETVFEGTWCCFKVLEGGHYLW